MSTDSSLICLWNDARRGNLKAYGEIYEEFFPKLYRYVLKMVNDEDLSQDLIQDLFVKLWERKEVIGAIHNVNHYFFKSARFLTINYINKAKRNQKQFDIDDLTEFSGEDILMRREKTDEIAAQITQALNNLPNRQKQVIFLKYYHCFSYTEISAMTGLRYQSIANYVHKGMQQLRTLSTAIEIGASTDSICSPIDFNYLNFHYYAE